MDVKVIKELATKYTVEQLFQFADELESTGKTSCSECLEKTDLNSVMSDFLQAAEVRGLIDGGMPLNEAVRDFSKRVRGVLS
ncbi:MAG: hypothetical protein V4591_10275 [Bdellovibrionota bacterium]